MKTYSQVVVETLEKMYATNSQQTTISSLAIASWGKAFGSKANFIPGPGKNKGKFDLNRLKRFKTIVDSDTDANVGDQIIKRLNKASKADWETIETVISTKRDFIIKEELGDAENFSENPAAYKSGIEQEGALLSITQEEEAITKIVADAGVTKISLGDMSGDLEVFGEKLFDAIALKETDVQQFVDDFVHMSETTTHVSPFASKALRAYKGTIFNVDKSAYADSIVPNFTMDNASKGMINAHFDKFTVDQSAAGGEADEKIVAIIMKDDAYFDAGITGRLNPLDTKLLDVTIKGHSFWGASCVVDPARIVVITAKTATQVVKKVGA